MFEMKLTDPGEGLVEAEIVAWHVAPGDAVKINDVVVEVETAKSVVELPSPFEGVVGELRCEVGDVVEVGSVIMTVFDADDPGENPPDGATTGAESEGQSATREPAGAQTESATDAAGAGDATPEASGALLVGYGAAQAPATRRPRKGVARPDAGPQGGQVNESYGLDETPAHKVDEVYYTSPIDDEPAEPPLPQPSEARARGAAVAPTDPVGRPLAKPAVRRLARDLGLDLATVAGTGPGGSITPNDVAQAAAGEAGGRRPTTRIPLRGVRRQMVQSMTASLQVPQASVWMDVDVTNTVELIEQLRGRREFAGLRISPILVLAKAVCLAMQRHPDVNGTLDLERGEIVVRPDVNLGIAAATQRGLVVPNIKRANELNLVELAQALNDLVATVREGRITPADAADGTFTITNVGVFGVEGGTPILNPGESAILLLGTFNRRPWVVGEGADERIVIRSVAKLTLSIDHRVLDGEQASRFLADVATILTDPGLALLY
ncbi:dihydrolipoamide acetyltransferase family protein [Propioniciclava soli]|uniref:dihydrolipoamide acetyltransferase family protein n=1 Tax=Propioniciclava soli TaxID=2775081 RepID=UPI001E35F04F|nr:dihydrolipoamide acetyltransferase family protein [Propioniciclava soli]